MPSTQQVLDLIKAAKEHNIELSNSDIEIIKKSPSDSPLAKWLNDFNPSHLLSPEDVQIWRHIQDTNVSILESGSGSTESLTDTKIRCAISQLEASTRRLDAQTETLDAQHSLLARQSHRSSQLRSQLAAHITVQHRKATQQAQNVHLANVAKLTDLKSRLRSRKEQLEKESRTLQPKVTERLKGDDRGFDSLQNFLAADVAGRANSEHSFNAEEERGRIELLLKALSKARAEEIRDKLDTVFLEELNRSSVEEGTQDDGSQLAPDSDAQTDSKAMTAELKADIQSLYEEINDVAGMLVEHEHGAPLRRCLDEMVQAEEREKQRVLSTAVQKIKMMTHDLDFLRNQIEAKRSEKIVLGRMAAEIERVERDMTLTNIPTTRPVAAQQSGDHRKLEEMMGQLRLSHSATEAQDTDTKDTGSHDSTMDKLEAAAQQRKEAVAMLPKATASNTNVEDGLEALEKRIAEARAELES